MPRARTSARRRRRPEPTAATAPAAPSSPLDALLQAIAADPEAGAWGQWARRLLTGDSPAPRKGGTDASR
jgi:hypothetical protein